MSLISRIQHGLSRTRVQLAGVFSGAVIDDDLFEELEERLICADVGMHCTQNILNRLRDAVRIKGLKTAEEVRLQLRDEIVDLLKPAQVALNLETRRPLVIMTVGVNGAGKTTSIGKLSKWFSAQGKSVLLAAADTFRAAAKEQLGVWGIRNGVEVISQTGGDPAAVTFDAVSAAKARSLDIVLADTAGRLPTQANLMQELSRIARAATKALPGAPHEVVCVVDGTTGQNALAQVNAFDAATPLTGLVVTKLDGTAKGGFILALCEARRSNPLPIYFVGVGEGIDDFEPFDALSYANGMVGLESEVGSSLK